MPIYVTTIKMKDISRVHTQVPIEIFPSFREQRLASGTAFLYLLDGRTYLVTNWHNVTGRRPDSYEPLSKTTSAIPDTITVRFPVLTEVAAEEHTRRWETIKIDLYDNEQPRWLEHPEHGPFVDLVALDVPHEFINASVIPANYNKKLGSPAMGITAGSDAFVLGFPARLYGGEYLPLWKKASIASEPGADVDGLPKVLIDAATRRGMSGSPVFGQVSGLIFPDGVKPTDPDWVQKTYFGIGNRFLGIYSGAYGREPFEAQVGIVWKESAIQETIRGGKVGASSFLLATREINGVRRQEFFDWDNWPFSD